MKNAFLLVLLLCVGTTLLAQKPHFIYIQSDTQAPFYVKMGDKVFSASASGYLLLSQLPDSTYSLVIGPSATDGELQFSVALRQADRGFLLKKFAEGWGLFDLQSVQVIRPTNASAGFSQGDRVRDDRFTHLLAEAADDTTLFYQPVLVSSMPAKKVEDQKNVAVVQSKPIDTLIATVPLPNENQEQKKDTATTIAIDVAAGSDQKQTATTGVDSVVTRTELPVKDSVVVADKNPDKQDVGTSIASDSIAVSKTAGVTKEADAVVAFKKSKITRRAESSTVDGFGLVYWDELDGVVDTVQIFIPNQKFLFSEPVAGSNDSADKISVKETSQDGTISKGQLPVVAKSCNGKASDKDFFRIRKDLVSYDSETEMVIAAKSGFRKKCYSTDQIKNLCTLFLTQNGKWQFLEAAFPHVNNKAEFASLQSELREEPYLSRFKAMIEN